MSFAGSFTPGLSAAIRESLHLRDLAGENLRDDVAGELERLRYAREVVRDHDCAKYSREVQNRAPFAFASSASVIGASDAPKSTVPSVSCRMPPPDPIDW